MFLVRLCNVPENVIFTSKKHRNHKESSPLICSAIQWTGFYMIGTFVMKELRVGSLSYFGKFTNDKIY